MSVRYSFVAQFLEGAAIFVRSAHELEGAKTINESDRARHRSLVVSAVIQSAAALEAECAEIIHHGPGHHLGSNGKDLEASNYITPIAEVLDRHRPTVERYQLILHLLRKPQMKKDSDPYVSASLMNSLRNELIHYKSKWGEEMEGQKLFSRLEQLRLARPSFAEDYSNFFPHYCLSASLGSWCVTTTVNFINEFHANLGVKSPLESHGRRFDVPAAKRY